MLPVLAFVSAAGVLRCRRAHSPAALLFAVLDASFHGESMGQATETDLAASGAPCQMADLFLHSPADADGNAQPVDTTPVAGKTRTFAGQLDYQMTGFDVEARAVPQERCKVIRMHQSTIMVDPGSHVTTHLTIQDRADSSKTLSYEIRGSRLQGTETDLRRLKIAGAYLVPNWKPTVHNYSAYLDVNQDIIRVVFQRMDNGQVVGMTSALEEPISGHGRRLQGFDDDLRPPIGEVQYLPASLSTTIDVGHQRNLEVLVQSADRSRMGRYHFAVQRPFCPPERRYFDGDAKACTDICNEGSFGNPATGRCSLCLQKNCAVCDTAKTCTLCVEGFTLTGSECVGASGLLPQFRAAQKAGEAAEKYGQRHLLLVTILVLACMCATCACVWLTCTGVRDPACCNVRRNARLPNDDSDDDFSTVSSYAYS